MIASLGACSGSGGAEESAKAAEEYEDPAELDYEYGEDVTFHSDEPVTYTMLFSDHENYPYKEDWRLWSAIEEKTNVTFDLTLVARTDYNDKVSALVNSGEAPWIIPKTYDASNYVDFGQIIPISDWVQYMPNYMKCVNDWGMEEELKTTYQSDGKYYRLPGMWELAAGGYSLIIRKDVFEAAGVDVEELEKNWTWDDFYEALLKVKEYTSRLENGIMISQSALDDLGEEGFVKMLRFIDWLWYSDEGLMLTQWGVEGETYTLDDEGNVVLNSDIYYNGINPGASKQLNVDYGFGGGVFAYGGSEWLRFSKFTDAEKDWNQRVLENTEPQKLDPPIMADEMQKEEMNLIQVPLMDYVNQSALQFITGDLDIENDWDNYVSQCEAKGSQDYIDQANEIFEDTKDVLGME